MIHFKSSLGWAATQIKPSIYIGLHLVFLLILSTPDLFMDRGQQLTTPTYCCGRQDRFYTTFWWVNTFSMAMFTLEQGSRWIKFIYSPHTLSCTSHTNSVQLPQPTWQGWSKYRQGETQAVKLSQGSTISISTHHKVEVGWLDLHTSMQKHTFNSDPPTSIPTPNPYRVVQRSVFATPLLEDDQINHHCLWVYYFTLYPHQSNIDPCQTSKTYGFRALTYMLQTLDLCVWWVHFGTKPL